MNFRDYISHICAYLTIAKITEKNPNLIDSLCARKRAVGSMFSFADFYTGRSAFYGYCVFEPVSGLIFTFECETRADALNEARTRISAYGLEFLKKLLPYQRNLNAQKAAQQAIEKAAQLKTLPKPRKVGRRMKAIFDEAGGKCHYCKAELTLDGRWHIEHKMPRALGGDSSPTNLVAACVSCNYAKRDKTDIEFMASRKRKSTIE